MTTIQAFQRMKLTYQPDESVMEIDETTEGYCYLCLFEPDSYAMAASICGRYPVWESVTNLRGGFLTRCAFVSRRLNPGVYHIYRTRGAGFSPGSLPIPKSGMVGQWKGDERILTYVWKTVWTVIMFQAFYQRLEFIIPSIVMAYITTFAAAPFVQPEIVRAGCTVKRALPTRRNMDISRNLSHFKMSSVLRLTVYFGLITIGFTKLFKFEGLDAWMKEKTDNASLPENFQDVHADYLKCHSYDTDLICCNDDDIIFSILDLDMDDQSIEQYIEIMCPSVLDDPKWFAKAKTAATRHYIAKMRSGPSMEDSVDQAIEVIAGETKSVAKDIVKGTEKFGSGFKHAIKSATWLASDATVGAFGEAEETIRATGKMSKQAVSSIRTTVSKFENPGEVVATTLKVVHEHTKDVIEMGRNSIDEIAETVKEMPNPGKIISGKLEGTKEFVSTVNEGLPGGQDIGETTVEIGNNLYGKVKTVAQTLDQGVESFFSELIKQSPDGETVANRLFNVGNWFKDKGQAIVETAANDVASIYQSAKDGSMKTTIDDGLNEVPKWSTAIGRTIGALPRGILEGFGVQVEETLLNPTPENVDNYIKTLTGDRKAKKRGRNWIPWTTEWSLKGATITSIILGATIIGVGQLYFE